MIRVFLWRSRRLGPSGSVAARMPRSTVAARMPRSTVAARMPRSTVAARMPRITVAARMPRITATALLAAGVLLPGRLAAAPELLSVEQCIDRALGANPAVLQSVDREDQAKAKLEEAGLQAMPSIAIGGTASLLSHVDPYSTSIPVGPGTSITFGFPEAPGSSLALRVAIQQPLYTGNRVRAGVDQSWALLAAARADSAKTRAQLASSVETAYWSLALAERSERVVEENVVQVQEHLKDAENLFAQGLVTKNEVLKVRIQLANTRNLLLEGRNGREAARARLAILIGRTWDAPIQTAGISETDEPPAPPPLESLLQGAATRRPELASLAAQADAARAGSEMALSARLPGVSLTGSFMLANPNPRVFPPRDRFDSTWDLGLALTIDVGRIPSALALAAQSDAQARQLLHAAAQLRDSVTLEVVQAYLNVTKSIEEIKAARDLIEQAEENNRIAVDRYRNGLALGAEKTDAENSLLLANLQYARSVAEYRMALGSLRTAAGEMP